MKYLLHPGAENDLRDAANYYHERAGTTLVESFLSEVDHALEMLKLHQEAGPSGSKKNAGLF